jgi:DNA polymerase-3 subunit alpha
MELGEASDHSSVIVAGMVVSLKEITTKQGKAMAFIEIEDQIERVEVVLFPEVWKRGAKYVTKGELLILLGNVQQQDEGFKLLADEVLPLEPSNLQQLIERRNYKQKQPVKRSKPTFQKTTAQAPTQKTTTQGTTIQQAAKEQDNQRVFIKIKQEAENPDMLSSLRALLQQHQGTMATVLFYESTGKLLALNSEYSIKPSPVLFSQIESMLGEGTVRVK